MLTIVEKFQTRGFEVRGILENQIEKVKRFGEFGMGKKPALKLEFGERRVLFCEGSHEEWEMLKDVSCCCWEHEGWKRRGRMEKKKMGVQRAMVFKDGMKCLLSVRLELGCHFRHR